jgi:hypothetical protein
MSSLVKYHDHMERPRLLTMARSFIIFALSMLIIIMIAKIFLTFSKEYPDQKEAKMQAEINYPIFCLDVNFIKNTNLLKSAEWCKDVREIMNSNPFWESVYTSFNSAFQFLNHIPCMSERGSERCHSIFLSLGGLTNMIILVVIGVFFFLKSK